MAKCVWLRMVVTLLLGLAAGCGASKQADIPTGPVPPPKGKPKEMGTPGPQGARLNLLPDFLVFVRTG